MALGRCIRQMGRFSLGAFRTARLKVRVFISLKMGPTSREPSEITLLIAKMESFIARITPTLVPSKTIYSLAPENRFQTAILSKGHISTECGSAENSNGGLNPVKKTSIATMASSMQRVTSQTKLS